MNFGEHIAQQFPGVKWTGDSHIHRSKMGKVGMSLSKEEGMDSLMASAHNGAIGLALWEYLQTKFADMDWQVTAEEFRAIIFVDIERHLTGQGDTQLPTKIRNPNTGNVFHRLAIRGDIVGGVRIWHEHDMQFGFRFRLAAMEKNEKEDLPVFARAKAMNAIKEAAKVVKKYKIAEPELEEVAKIRASVFVK